MYILMISRGIPSQSDPQWGCFELDQAHALAAAGHKVVMMSVDRRWRASKRSMGITYCCEQGIACYNIYVCPLPLQLLGLGMCVAEVLAKVLYKRIVKEQGRPDVLYAHYLYSSALGVYLARKANVPLVGIEHWSALKQQPLAMHVRYLGNKAYRYVNRVIAVSVSLAERIKRNFGVQPVVIHNMVGNEFLQPIMEKTDNDKFTYVTVGSLLYRKGFDLLIEACSKLNLSRERWQVKIIGGGPLQAALQQQIVATGLQGNIQLLGQKTKSEIIDVLQQSDAFVLSSRSETFSVVCIEALCQGLPCVATICGGPEEFIRSADGILVPVENVPALTDAMQQLYNNRQYYNRRQIAADARARFAPEVIARQLTAVFEEVVNK